MEVEGESKWMKIFPYCWLNWIALQLYTNTYSTSALMLSFIRFRQWSTLLLTDWAPALSCAQRRNVLGENSTRSTSGGRKSEIYYLFLPLALLLCVKSYFICRRTYLQNKSRQRRETKIKSYLQNKFMELIFYSVHSERYNFGLKYSRKHVVGWERGMFSLWMMIMREFVHSASLLNYFLGFNNWITRVLGLQTLRAVALTTELVIKLFITCMK